MLCVDGFGSDLINRVRLNTMSSGGVRTRTSQFETLARGSRLISEIQLFSENVMFVSWETVGGMLNI